MKKRMAFALTIAMVLLTFTAFMVAADDLGVTMIAGPEEESAETVSLEDVQIGQEIEIEGFGIIQIFYI